MLIKKLEIISIFRYHQQKLIHSEGMEVSFFRVDEFVKFDEFNKKLPIHIQWLDKCKYLFMITTGKIYISLVLFLIYIDVYFSFALFHYW